MRAAGPEVCPGLGEGRVGVRACGDASGDVGSLSGCDLLLYMSQRCPADFNQSGEPSVQDIFDFLAAYFAGCN